MQGNHEFSQQGTVTILPERGKTDLNVMRKEGYSEKRRNNHRNDDEKKAQIAGKERILDEAV